MDIEMRVRQLLLQVFYLSSVEEIRPEASLVKDLGAESLDFVQIIYLVEKEFGIVLEPDELLSGAAQEDPELLFVGAKLTKDGAKLLNRTFSGHSERFTEGMTKAAIYLTITVRDLAAAIETRMKRGESHA